MIVIIAHCEVATRLGDELSCGKCGLSRVTHGLGPVDPFYSVAKLESESPMEMM